VYEETLTGRPHRYKKLPVTMKMWMRFNVMPRTSLGVDAAKRNAQYKFSPQIPLVLDRY